MTRTSINAAKSNAGRSSSGIHPDIDCVAALPNLYRAFEEATGWSLAHRRGQEPIRPIEYAWTAPVNPGVGTSPGHVRLDLVRSASAAAEDSEAPTSVRRLASALEQLLSEHVETQDSLRKREVELAASSPVAPRSKKRHRLAARFQAVLRGGAEAVGCHAAALYLLDEKTTSLKLRASWGLPPQRLADPPRPLRGALADLEAMLGHAVVIEDAGIFQQWNVPEDFSAAVCVPVATSTTILGTLWFFCNSRRDFNDRETNIVEVVAGRLASDLDKEIVLRKSASGVRLHEQLDAARRIQRNQFPAIAPLIEGWDFAGWTGQAFPVGGGFFDWFTVPRASVAFSVGDAAGEGIEGALVASTVRAALRSHGQYRRSANTLLNQVNLTLWTGSAGDQSANVFCGFAEARSNYLRYAVAGKLDAILLQKDRWELLENRSAPLGQSPESVYRQSHCQIAAGGALVVLSEGFTHQLKNGSQSLNDFAQLLLSSSAISAKELVATARSVLTPHSDGAVKDRTIVVLKQRSVTSGPGTTLDARAGEAKVKG